MSLKEKVYKLLTKYESGETLSNSEKTELSQILEDDKYAEYVNAYYYSIWDEEFAGQFNSQKVYNKIHSSIANEGSSSPLQKIQGSPQKSKKYLFQQLLKYAAILVIGISISSIFHLFIYSHKDDTVSVVKYSTVEVEYGSKSKIVLPDGTQVWLNSGSKLTYPNKFNDKIRDIILDGEAYFDVVKDESRPFFVNTSDINIKVLGTKFNVKSYDDENTIETTLISGKVELKRKTVDDTKYIALKPNQKAVFYKSENTVEITSSKEKTEKETPITKIKSITIDRVDEPQVITSWKDGKLKFDAELFGSLAHKMKRWFDVQFVFYNESAKNIRFSGTFEDESIEQAMRALQISYPIKYEIKKNVIFIY